MHFVSLCDVLRCSCDFVYLRIDDNYNNPEINLTTHRVTPDNVVELLQRYSTPLEFDVLSLDPRGRFAACEDVFAAFCAPFTPPRCNVRKTEDC